MVSVTPDSLSLPGSADLMIEASAEAAPGVYSVTATATDGKIVGNVPILVHVRRMIDESDFGSVLRRPTEISLSSDSNLDQARMSLRGQLGILRSLASPTSVEVEALLPSGETLSATGVVAPTGEFTVEFEVPSGHEPGTDWIWRATWPGSLNAVGGSSPRFRLPVFYSGLRQRPCA